MMKLKELLSRLPYTCYLEIHSYEDARELMGWSGEMEKELKELGDYEIGYFEPINEPHAGLKISIHQLESSFGISTGGETVDSLKVSTGGETVRLESGVGIGVSPTYNASGWPYENRNPEYPLQSEEEAKKVKTATVPNMQTNLGDIQKAQQSLEQKDYYVIHKLRKNEVLTVGAANQLVAVTDKKWIAEDICKKYTFHNSEYEKLDYARVMTLVAQKQ